MKRTYSIFTIIFLAGLCTGFLKAQTQPSSIQTYEKALRTEDYVSIPWKRLYASAGAMQKDLPVLKRFVRDSAENVRHAGYQGLAFLPLRLQEAPAQRQAAELLLKGAQDPVRKIAYACAKGLRNFPAIAFAGKENALWDALENTPSQKESLIRLVGFVQPADAAAKLKSLRRLGKLKTRRERWAAQLALIRLNDPAATQQMLGRLKRNPVTDALVYDLFPELLYTRNREIYDFLVTVLQSDSIRCESPNPDSSKDMPCAYRVMELLAPHIQDFPLPVLPSGDIETDDYETALDTVRDWFRRQAGRYRIRTDRY